MVTRTTRTKASGNGSSRKQSNANHESKDVVPKWTFLTNHAHVLAVLDADPDLVLRQVALRVGITERAVQRIIVELEESGFLEREKIGRQNHYNVLKKKSLRHPIESHRNIGDLLTMLTK